MGNVMTKISDYVVEFLIEKEINKVFGYIGGAIAHLYHSIDKYENIEMINCIHEQGAGFAADTDVKVAVSSNDTTAGFLNGKLVAGDGIDLTEGSDGGNETLTVAVEGEIVQKDVQNTFTKSQVASTETATISTTKTLDFDTYQNFILTLGSGANTLANPTTEASQIGQTGVMILIQPSSGSAGTISLGTDYETVGGAGLTLSSTNSAYDIVPYVVKADNSILIGSPQLAFS
mgnify:CR=1 FL=1